MGFEAPTNLLKLIFTDPSYEGLEVYVRFVGADDLAEASKLQHIAAKDVRPSHVAGLLDQFAERLVSWNVTIDGEDVPATRDGIRRLDILFQLPIIEAWVSAYGTHLNDLKLAEDQRREQAADDVELSAGLKVLPLVE